VRQHRPQPLQRAGRDAAAAVDQAAQLLEELRDAVNLVEHTRRSSQRLRNRAGSIRQGRKCRRQHQARLHVGIDAAFNRLRNGRLSLEDNPCRGSERLRP